LHKQTVVFGPNIDINKGPAFGTPLSTACYNFHSEMAKWLLENGAGKK
jgi:hypothetical protein